jgi:NAD+ kinase
LFYKEDSMKVGSVLLVGDLRKEGVPAGVKRLSAMLKSRLVVRQRMGDQVSLANTDEDLIVVLGGDGSVLSAVRRLGNQTKPVMGINFGHLGFLAARSSDELEQVASDIVTGNFRLSVRMRLEMRAKGRQVMYLRSKLRALNDVVIERATGRTCWITLVEHTGEETTFGGDGMIVSTSTGTTAYTKSARGPIIDPETENVVVTPICPLELSARPVVGDGRHPVVLRIHPRSAPVRLVVDGREISVSLKAGDEVKITRSATLAQLAVPPDWSYTRVLKSRLGWNSHPQ